MSSEPPRPGAVPGWGQQPEQGDQPAPPEQPGSDVPAPGTPGAVPGWGQQPQPSTPAPTPPAATPPAPTPGGVPGWGQQPEPAPPAQTPTPEAPAPTPGPPVAAPSFGTPAAPPMPTPAPTAPAPPSGGWGAPPTGPQPMAGGAPPGTWSPQPAAPSGNSGCLKACLIVAVLGIVLLVVLVVGFVFIVNRAVQETGINSDGSIGTQCGIISDADLSSALGSQASAVELTGLFDLSLGLILDKRVLPDAPDCWITSDGSNAIGRIARYDGGDAASVFAQERQNAEPTSQDQGNGLSIESSGYFGGDVQGLGDEAFCTGVTLAGQAGVLVRRGDTLVYVSMSSAGDTTPNYDSTDQGVVTAPTICAQAQEVAKAILK
jgi:hypothetical protein